VLGLSGKSARFPELHAVAWLRCLRDIVGDPATVIVFLLGLHPSPALAF
jgi:hypothetical protein